MTPLRPLTATLAFAVAGALTVSVLTPTAASAADPADPYGEGLKNTNAQIGYPTFVNGDQAIPANGTSYDPTVSYLARVYATDAAAGAGTAPGKDFWLDKMLARDGVQPDEAGGLDFVTDQPADINYDNNGVFFSRGRALYMQDSATGLGFRGRVAYIEDLGGAAYTLDATIGGSAVTLREDESKRHNTPSYWYTEYTGGGMLVKQTKFITRQNVAVERLQVTTTDGSSKTVTLTAGSQLARTVSGNELTGSVTTAHNVTQVTPRLSGDGFTPAGTSLTRTITATGAVTDLKLQMGFTTAEIPDATTEYQNVVTATGRAAFQTQTSSYNQWWVDNIPYLQTPSGEIDKTLFYRWWLLRTNFLDAQVPGNDYQFPTSLEGVFGAAYNNAIVLTAGMFIDDMKYFRDPTSAYGTWLSAGEVARNDRYIDNPGNPVNWNSSYANYISEAAWRSYQLHGGDPAVAEKLAGYAEDDINGQLREFDSNNNNLIEYSNPALTGNDVDAVSFSWRNTAAWSSYPMDRPESAYLYSGATAAAAAYRLAGDQAGATRMDDQAAAIKKSVLDVMWENKRPTADEAGLFGNQIKAAYSDASSGLPAGSKIPWKEVNMYYPYTVGLMPKPGDADFDQKYLDAFRLFVDSSQYAPFPFYTANQKDAAARAARDAGSGKHYSNNFSTINSTVMFRLLSSTLRDYPNSYLTADYYKKMLYWNAWASYEKGDVTRQNENEFWSHGSAADGGSIKYRSWIHQTQLGTTNFTVIEDAMGLRPRTDDVIELSPIDIDWDHFTANNMKYHDKDLTIVWDAPGGKRYYGDTPEGYSVYLDGIRAFTIDSLVPVSFNTTTGDLTTDANVLFSKANAVTAAKDIRFDADAPVVSVLAKAGVDVNPVTEGAPDLAAGTKVTASYTAPGTTAAGNAYTATNAVDGSTANEPFWGTAGSPNPVDSLEIDLGAPTSVNEARVYFYRSSSSTTVPGYAAPRSYSIEGWDGTSWTSVTAQARTPQLPTANYNLIRFADVNVSKLRITVAHQDGLKTGVKEVQLRHVAGTYTPSQNQAPAVSVQRVATADPSQVRFTGSVSDDGLPSGQLTGKWTVLDTPTASATVRFADDTSVATTAAFSATGTYRLAFTATDGDKTTTVEQTVTVTDVRPFGPDVASYATPTASYVAPWNRLAAINDGETVTAADPPQTKLWGTYSDNRPATQTLTYTWPTATRLASASAAFWNDAAPGSGTGVAVPAGWSLDYLDGSTWKPVVLRAGGTYTTGSTGTPNTVSFQPVTTTQIRATLQASRAANGAYSAVAMSELDVFADYPSSYEAIAKRTSVNTPVTLPGTATAIYPGGQRGDLQVTFESITADRFAAPGTITVNGVFTGSTIPVTATISVGESGNEISAIDPQTATTYTGTAPVLPRTAVATFSGGNGARESRAVTWDQVEPAAYAQPGQFVVQGTVAGTTIRASATVTVENDPTQVSVPPAPTAPTATVSGDDVTVNWETPNGGGADITAYTVTVTPATGTAIVKTVTTGTTASFTNLPAGPYTATVTATNAQGTSPASAGTAFVIEPVAPVTVTTTATSAQPVNDAGWYRTPVTVTITASDRAATVQYRVNNGAWATSGDAPVTVTAEGTTTIDYRALSNNAPIAGTEGTTVINLDTVAPATTATVDPPAGTVDIGRAITATFPATDATSGVAYTEYSTDGGTTWTGAPAAGVSFTQRGTYTISYRSVDTAGNTETTRTVTLTVAEPKTTATAKITSADAPSVDNWYQQSVLVALTAPGSGLKIQYRINSGGWRSYTNSISVTANGTTTIEHRLLKSDAVVTGSEAQTQVKIDKTAPAVTATRTPGSGTGTPRNPISIQFTATDTHSGVAGIAYRLNSGTWSDTGAEPVVLNQVGDWVVSYRATDKAGNVSAPKSMTVTIKDNTVPTVKTNASTVKPGAAITIALSGFARWDDVTLTLGTVPLKTVLTDQNGSARITVRIPQDTANGVTTVTAVGSDGTVTAAAKVTVKK